MSTWPVSRAHRRTHLAATLAFLGIAALDAFHPATLVTGSWWLVLLLVWILPWPDHRFDPSAPARLSRTTLLQFTALAVFSWLYFRANAALVPAFITWHFFDPNGIWQRLSFPIRVALQALLVAALLAHPLHRTFGRDAVAAAFVIAAPSLADACIDRLSDITRWLDRPSGAVIHTFYAAFPLLLLMQACAWLERRAATRPTRTISAPSIPDRLSRLFDRCPPWFARSAVAPVLVLTAVATALRLWFENAADLPHAFSVLLLLNLPLCTLVLTAAAVHAFRRRSAARDARPHTARIVNPLDALLSALLLLPLWLWTLTIDAPMVEHLAVEAVAALPGPAWELRYDPANRTMHLEGEIQRGTARAFSERLAQQPDVEVVALSGPGGSSNEGFAIAAAIEARSLATRAVGDCDSACTTAFMGGHPRTLDPEARLGFHSGWSPVALYDDDDADYNAYLEYRGVHAAFIRRADEVPADDMWYPTRDELVDAGVITTIQP